MFLDGMFDEPILERRPEYEIPLSVKQVLDYANSTGRLFFKASETEPKVTLIKPSNCRNCGSNDFKNKKCNYCGTDL